MKRLVFFFMFVLCVSDAAAQDTIPVRADTVAADTAARRFPPSKALMRSFLLPGWGQFSVGATRRGIFFAAAQGTSYYMLARTNSRLNDAEEKLEVQRNLVRDSILEANPQDTVNLEARIDTIDSVVSRQSLVSSRERHMQDWIAYTLFFTLASGVDAFVAAHLADFPVAIDPARRPDGSTEVKFTLPLPSRRKW